jgi:N-acetylneuraminic acid mutarotase
LAVGVVNGVLYAVGGLDGSLAQGGPVEAYDPVTNTWTTKARMPVARGFLGVGVMNSTLYAVGSGVLEAYDPVADTWTTKAPMPTRRSAMGVGVVDGLLYTLGGVPTAGSTSGFMNKVEVYDPTTNTWATNASMLTARSEFGVGVLNNSLYAIGGYAPLSSSSYGFVSTNEVFQPKQP